MIPASQISGLVLSGGYSSRMQAQAVQQPSGLSTTNEQPCDKGLLLLQGQPLVAHCCAQLTPWVQHMYISANRYADAYAIYGMVVADDPLYGERQGALAGIATVLARIHTPWLAVLPVDSPVVPRDMVPRLAAAVLQGNYDLAYVQTERTHPLCLLIHVSCLPALQSYLRADGRRVLGWVQSQHGVAVDFNAIDDKVWNVNTPAELEALRAYLEASGDDRSGQPER